MTPNSRACDSAHAARVEWDSIQISWADNTVVDAGMACRRASYDAGAGGASRLEERGQHAVEALGAVADE